MTKTDQFPRLARCLHRLLEMDKTADPTDVIKYLKRHFADVFDESMAGAGDDPRMDQIDDELKRRGIDIFLNLIPQD